MDLTKKWKSYGKVNIFFKVVGKRDGYHEMSSRFVLVRHIYDELWFAPILGQCSNCDQTFGFMIEGDFDCAVVDNTLYKSYVSLLKFLQEKEKLEDVDRIRDFFKSYKIVVNKRLPAGSGLGAGSSNAAVFLHMINETLELNLSLGALWQIGQQVGSDVNFFLSNWSRANVRGIGEKIEQWEEDPLDLEIFTPNIHCSTPKVFAIYRERFFDETNIDIDFVRTLESMTNKEILIQYEIDQLNDLLGATLQLYPELEKYIREGWFLSGSGSSLFRVRR